MTEKKRIPKLHEILAVESDLEGGFKNTVEETKTAFSQPENFMAVIRTLTMHDDKRAHEQEGAGERRDMVTTVPKMLEEAKASGARYFDALLQKEATNQNAKADLIVDGRVIAKDLPATFLLGLESRLKLVKGYISAIPMHAAGHTWVPDPDIGKDVYMVEDPEKKQKTEKTFRHKVLYDATDHHPAQIEKWEEAVVVGTYTRQFWSGMLSQAQKGELLGRIDKMIRAVKKARQRANTEEVVDRTVGKEIFDYILHG